MAVMQQFYRQNVICIHLDTSNKSFLDMHYYLKNKGIQNNDFFLALLDTDLRGVNPRDPNLSMIMKQKILRECMNNYWYYLREVVYIKEQGSVGDGVRYKLDRGNLAMNFLFTLNYNQFVELPRQFGKTTTAVIRYLWVYNFGTTNSEIMFLHKAHEGSKKNLRQLKDIRDNLPPYLRFDSAIGVDGKKLKVPNTAQAIQHPFNHNRILTLASARSPESANNIGRGNTMPCQYYDEFAFMPYNKDVYLAATPAFSRASQNAKKNNAPYGILITTTPGDLLTTSGAYAYQLRNDAKPWLENYYDMSFEELEGLNNTGKNRFFHVRFTYQQLGAGQDYFMRMVQEMSSEWPAIRREVLLEWAETLSDCPFSTEDLDTIKTHLKQPIRTLLFGQFNQYQLNIYEDLDLSYPPIIGVDVAGATFNDSSAITIIDSHTTRVCATLNSNFIPADDLADVIFNIVYNYMPNAIINIESNGGFGKAVIQRLCKTTIKRNLYWEIKDKVLEESFDGYRMQKRQVKAKVYGLNTTKDVRARLIELLMERVKYHKDKFVAPILHHEMSTMVVKANGKVEHSDKNHDDQVFSYLMCLYVWYDGKNLAENFGIIKNSLRTDSDEELMEPEFGLEHNDKVKIDLKRLEADDIISERFNEELNNTLEWVTKDFETYRTYNDLSEQIRQDIDRGRMAIMNSDPRAKEKMVQATGVDLTNYMNNNNFFTEIPINAFNMDIDASDEELYRDPRLAGNLANFGSDYFSY